MLVMTHLLFSLISINPYKTSNMNPRFYPLLMISSMTESNLVMLRRTKSANSYLKSSFHSFKLKIKGSTNRANSFSKDWHDPKLIKVDKQIFVSFWLLMTLLISEKRSVPMNSSLDFSVLVCWRITLRAPCLTYILGSFISATSSWTSSGVNWLCYSVDWAFDYGSIEVSFYWQKVVINLFYLPCFNFIKEFNLMFYNLYKKCSER